MEEIINILMKRDGLSRKEVIREIKSFIADARQAIDEGRGFEVEDILASDLGLEPDYLFSMYDYFM